MKMKTILLFWLFVFCTGWCWGQNLVPNGSFEDTIHCPKNIGEVDSCMSWHAVLGTPDFFSTCASGNASVPDNIMGYQPAFEGNNYMGFCTFNGLVFYREIIGAELLDLLEIGKNYNISMRVSKGNHTWGSYNTGITNKLGIRFSTSYSSINPPVINNSATVYCDSMITDTANWILLSWNYVADSAYKYIAIGNFFDDDHTDTTNVDAFNGGRAYYFIDSVNVYCADANCITSVNTTVEQEHITIFNSNTKTLGILSEANNTYTVNILNYNGQLVKSIEAANNVTVSLSNLIAGIYIVYIKMHNKFFTQKITIY